jgi:beta-phosphoglucomutase-like phosphatase (HAD superfamily)
LIKVAIFDMDGLLIDSERIIMEACILAAADLGITYTQAEYVQLIGRSAPDSSRLMAAQLGGVEQLEKLAVKLNALLDQRNHAFPLKDGAEHLVMHFQQLGIACGVASSSAVSHIEHRLHHVDMLNRFSSITSGQEVENGKPSPDIYELAMRKMGVQAKDCIAFEDSEQGARAAIAAGLRVVVVPDLLAPSAFVRQHCFAVVENLSAFLRQLSANPTWLC